MSIVGHRAAGSFSPALLPSDIPRRVAQAAPDIVNLHWVGGEFMSIGEIGRLRLPVVWTIHDMWAFSGAEHYPEDDRWKNGYKSENRALGEAGLDLNRWVWNRKRRHWRTPAHIVAPSHWLGECVSQSALMKEWSVSVIPNPIDTTSWAPMERSLARQLLGVPKDAKLVGFGAMGGTQDPRKGFDLLEAALRQLSKATVSGIELVVFGEERPRDVNSLGLPVHYTGRLSDDMSLRVVYNALDVFVLSSRMDNLPNTGVEALSCGTPVVAFRVGGLPDIVCHTKTGWLAEKFDVDDLARGILWTISDPARASQLRERTRNFAVETFSEGVVIPKYVQLYDELVARGAHR